MPCASSAKSLFYQPQTTDESLTVQDWEKQLSAAREAGYTAIILQWMQYGDVTFYNSEIVKRISQAPSSKSFDFWVGLFMPDDYYNVMEDQEQAKYYYIDKVLNRSTSLLAIIDLYGLNQQFRIKGWYLPLEISSSYLRAEERMQILARLKEWRESVAKPVGLSYFVGYQNNLAQSERDVADLSAHGFTTFFQRSNGIIQKNDAETLFPDLDCNTFVVTEAFEEIQAGQFIASNHLPVMNSCHNQAVFSLRYLPFSRFQQR
ncbi:hypothetical protein GCM10007391_27730 [Alteromonas halophila]|uniref:DUF4434 domain-containing protein n=1 Tax=Alteromonas halophila TaxID=516698 RepID=A0A918MZD9_9ALTE|nr:hypothetical protein GCM10007391_27730 [Alteromonas halophila]